VSKEGILRLRSQFDALVQEVPDEQVEFWFARDLQEPLGYARWERFLGPIERAIESCKNAGFEPSDHFRGAAKMIEMGCGLD
jgi:DNA-damage-inducible protein D